MQGCWVSRDRMAAQPKDKNPIRNNAITVHFWWVNDAMAASKFGVCVGFWWVCCPLFIPYFGRGWIAICQVILPIIVQGKLKISSLFEKDYTKVCGATTIYNTSVNLLEKIRICCVRIAEAYYHVRHRDNTSCINIDFRSLNRVLDRYDMHFVIYWITEGNLIFFKRRNKSNNWSVMTSIVSLI